MTKETEEELELRKKSLNEALYWCTYVLSDLKDYVDETENISLEELNVIQEILAKIFIDVTNLRLQLQKPVSSL